MNTTLRRSIISLKKKVAFYSMEQGKFQWTELFESDVKWHKISKVVSKEAIKNKIKSQRLL